MLQLGLWFDCLRPLRMRPGQDKCRNFVEHMQPLQFAQPAQVWLLADSPAEELLQRTVAALETAERRSCSIGVPYLLDLRYKHRG